MNLQRREEISALLAAPVTGGAGQVLEYRDALMECRAHIDTLEQTAAERVIADGRAPAVVVPDDTFTLDLDEFGEKLACITINSKNRGIGYKLCGTMGDGHFSRRTFNITPYLAHCLNTIGVRAISADRVLGEGMVQVDPGLLMLLDKALESCKYAPQHVLREAIRDVIRANQGGAAT